MYPPFNLKNRMLDSLIIVLPYIFKFKLLFYFFFLIHIITLRNTGLYFVHPTFYLRI